jgi:hypothetical protein
LSSAKKIKDAEFKGWKFMSVHVKNPTLWVYTSEDSTQFALVNSLTNDVMFIMDRATGIPLYTNPNTNQQAHNIMRARLAKRLV